MKILRIVFAPFLWVRDIRDELRRIRRIQLINALMQVHLTPLSDEAKEMLFASMLPSDCLGEHKGDNGNDRFREKMEMARRLLKVLEDES